MAESLALEVEPENLAIVREILARVIPDREVWAFGSRVTGRGREYSDLDLAVIGGEPLDWTVYSLLKNEFSDSDLPWRVDVVDWASTRPSFQDIIKRQHVVIQEPR